MNAERTEPLYPSEMVSGRLANLDRLHDHVGHARARARHGRSYESIRRLAGYDQMFWNSVYWRWCNMRGGSWYGSSSRSHLKRYQKRRLRWRRLSKDRTLSPGARRIARAMACGVVGCLSQLTRDEHTIVWHEAFEAKNAVSRAWRPDEARFARWIASGAREDFMTFEDEEGVSA
jgi:hypothetical protein